MISYVAVKIATDYTTPELMSAERRLPRSSEQLESESHDRRKKQRTRDIEGNVEGQGTLKLQGADSLHSAGYM